MVIAVASFGLALHPDRRAVGTGIGSAAPTPRRARDGRGLPRRRAGRGRAVGVARRRCPTPLRREFGDLVAAAALADRRRARHRGVPPARAVGDGPARPRLGLGTTTSERRPDGCGSRPDGQRRAARGRRRLGGREPALRPARAARPARLQERLRAGRVRLVHGLPRRRRRCCACLVAAGQAEGRERRHRRGPGRPATSCTRCSRRSSRPARCSAASARPGLLVADARPARPRPRPGRPRDPRGAGRQPVPLHRLREDPRRRAAGRRAADADDRLVIDGCAVVHHGRRRAPSTPSGHVVVDGNRIAAVGAGPAPRRRRRERPRTSTAPAAWLTPGLVNTHHHLYQWADPRARPSTHTLFEWLTALYPVWAGIDEDVVRAAATGALGWLARTGCTTTHRPPLRLPGATAATCSAPRSTRPARSGLRFHPTRGSMDLGASQGGLPPDSRGRGPRRDPRRHRGRDRRGSTTRRPTRCCGSAVAPCSPFSVTGDLMREAAALARGTGVRLHTHLAETDRRGGRSAGSRFGCTPVEYVESLGWLGADVWLAHGVHLDDAAIARLAATGTGVAHCPSSNARLGAGIAPDPRPASTPGVPVGLGVDGAASNEAGSLLEELRHAAAVRPGPRRPAGADRARRRCELATDRRRPGARPGRPRSARSRSASSPTSRCGGSTRCRTPASPTRSRPWCSASPPPLELLLVDGRPVVEHDRLVTVDEDELARRRGRGVAAGCWSAEATTSDRHRRGHPAPGTRRRRSATTPLRPDGTLKVTGEFAYASDLWIDDMLWGVTLRSPHPHARIRSIDIAEALAAARRLRGAHRRRRARARSLRPRARTTSRCSPSDVVRYQGEPVALVAADHPETARRAAARIVVDYEVLEPVTDAAGARWTRRRRAGAPRRATWSGT